MFIGLNKIKDWWVITDNNFFRMASEGFFNEFEEWISIELQPRVVKYINFQGCDLKYLNRWLNLPELGAFSVADTDKNGNFDFIYPLTINPIPNIEKLIWIDLEGTLYEMQLGDVADISKSWVENHRCFHQENCHHN